MGNVLTHTAANEVRLRGRKLLYFGGSDYLRQSWRPEIRRRMANALADEATTVGASRVTSGNHPLHERLERRLAAYHDLPAAVVTSTGYTATLVAGQILAPKITHVILDASAHACLHDAAQLSGARRLTFPFGDVQSLRQQIRKCGRAARVAVFTNGLTAHDGRIPPLVQYLEVLPKNGWLLIDDAHGVGTIGARGRGAVEVSGARDPRLLLTMTFSKAIGVYGGAVVGPAWIREAVWSGSRVFGGATPMSVSLIEGVLESLQILAVEGCALRRQLQANAAKMRALLDWGSADPLLQPGPQFTVVLKNSTENHQLSQALLRAGIYPTRVRYFGGPAPEFFRFALSAGHTPDQLERLSAVLKPVRDRVQ